MAWIFIAAVIITTVHCWPAKPSRHTPASNKFWADKARLEREQYWFNGEEF